MSNPNEKGPYWLDHARKYIGLREIKGPRHSSTIVKWLKKLGAGWRDDETPWCGTFVAGVLDESGLPVAKSWASARAWLKYGKVIKKPAVGCIVIFWRGKRNGWSGHVGFVVGKDNHGNLMVLGGNQGDAVNIKPFSHGRVLGYRWPGRAPYPFRYELPVVKSDGRLSNNEA